MQNQYQYHGSLVAFEGPADAVSIQLRLLPTSPQVLILPGIQTYMNECVEIRFSARAFVRDTHKAAQTRHDVAMNFLRGSSASNKRIVFLSGGTAGAVSQCISTISEQQALGDVLEAESIFKHISQGGVKALDQKEKYSDPKTLQLLGRDDEQLEDPDWETDEVEDPITKAMKAADALYEETDSLQPIDYFTRTRPRPRSLSLPLYGHTDDMGEHSPFFVFGSPNEEAQLDSKPDTDEPLYFQRATRDFSRVHSNKEQHGISKGHLILDRPPSCMGQPYKAGIADHLSQLFQPTSDVVLSPPPTPDGVVYGEARVVQMRASRANKQLRNTRSLDDMELNQTVRRRDSSVSKTKEPTRAAPPDVTEAKSRHLSIVEDPYSSNNLLHLPQARFVKAHKTTIRKSPTFQKRLPKPARESYVHRGTDAAESEVEHNSLDEPFQPVLPLTEDLVIHFTGEACDPILDSVIQSFKTGTFPVFSDSQASTHTGRTDSYLSTAITGDHTRSKDQPWMPRVAEHHSDREAGEYDPFAARGHDVRYSNLTTHTPSPPLSAVCMYNCQLPTPSQTPPPVSNTSESIFHDFSTTGRPNAVVVQNALRSMLEVYFPSHQYGGYNQSSRSPLPDMDNLWSPIFREREVHGKKITRGITDLILAIGCQRGVKGDFLPALVGQIEKLGAKSSGISRSGRLDIRYLVANAMQSFSAQPLAQQTHNNPFENPYLLACLIIPQLETYLAAHSRIRFLVLEYPDEHLATVLALQKLMGNNHLKVAGIMNSDSTSPDSEVSSLASSRQSSRSDTNSLDSTSLRGPLSPGNRPSLAHRRTYSFSKANYLLTCSATESEIAVFISTIWKLLIEADPFYVPERSPSHGSMAGTVRSVRGTNTGAVPPPRLTSRLTTLQGRNGNENSPVYTHTSSVSPHRMNAGGEGNSSSSSSSSTPRITTSAAALARDFPFVPPPPPPPPQAHPPPHHRSISPTPSTTSTMFRGRGVLGYTPGPRPRSRSTTTRRRLATAAEGGKDEGASLYAISVVEDGEFYDEEERRLMPMYMRQRDSRRGNSGKALKWLGLA